MANISYLEMALDGPLDGETRDNLSQSHAASKVLPQLYRSPRCSCSFRACSSLSMTCWYTPNVFSSILFTHRRSRISPDMKVGMQRHLMSHLICTMSSEKQLAFTGGRRSDAKSRSSSNSKKAPRMWSVTQKRSVLSFKI